jgi:hypothetical protein
MQLAARVFKRKVIAVMSQAGISTRLHRIARRLITSQLLRRAVRRTLRQ